jgi:hypothetical protein
MKHVFASLVVMAWVPFGVLFFTFLRPRKAVLAAYLLAWLFLPMRAGLVIKFLPDLDKVTASSLSVLIGCLLFDAHKLFSFRFKWFDIGMLMWVLTPFPTSIMNGLGYWDGLSGIFEQLALYGFPYYVGRVYFSDWEGIRGLAIAIFVGGLIYVPLCLIEIRMSPQLHKWVYGYYQHGFNETLRFGGWRPMVFMQHGLAVGFWMTAASLIGVWLLVTGSLKNIMGVPMIIAVPVLVMTTILCKSAAGIGFLFVGLGVLFTMKWTKTALPLYVLLLIPPSYMYLRASGTISGEWAVERATEVFGADRAQSLDYRMNAENIMSAHALERPWFGYGRWDPAHPKHPGWMVYDPDTGKKSAIVDGMWVLTLCINGLVGLFTLTTSVLLPVLLLRFRVPPKWWAHPMAAPAAALAVMVALHMCDNLLNAMLNPIFICAIGGIAALGVKDAQRHGFPVVPIPNARQARRPMMPNAAATPRGPARPAPAGVLNP